MHLVGAWAAVQEHSVPQLLIHTVDVVGTVLIEAGSLCSSYSVGSCWVLCKTRARITVLLLTR